MKWIVLEEEFVRRPDVKTLCLQSVVTADPPAKANRSVDRSTAGMTPDGFCDRMQGSNNFWLSREHPHREVRPPRDYSNKMIKDHLHCVHHEDV
jgi:hypothetical protein